MNIKETFLNLTKFTVPHGKEDMLRKYLPKEVRRDSFGNYSMSIGNSETLFTCHLDTVSTEMEEVEHVIDGNIIRTDGTTILGGDNKTGVCILLNMIEHNIPGTYYFFAGEEPTAKGGGLYGSKNALAANPEFFKRFKRAVCFDRKHEGSIVTRQMARFTCSNEFVSSLIEQFAEQGLEYHPDETGWYTDTAVFINVISEVTNLSSGTYKEHSTDEYVDMDYLQKVAEAALHIDWESLPSIREPKRESTKDENSIHNFKRFKNLKFDKNIFDVVEGYMSMFNFKCLNDDEFEPGLNMIFSQWHKEVRIYLKVENGIIWLNDERIGDIKAFEKYVGIGFEQKVDLNDFVEILGNLVDSMDTDTISVSKFKKLLEHFKVSFEDFVEYYNSKDCKLRGFLEYNQSAQKITIL